MCGSHVWLVTYSLCLPPGNSHWRRRSHQQSAALLYRERRPSAAVLYSPPQWRNHCPHCAGQRGGQCELKHKKKRIQIKRGKELNKRQKKKAEFHLSPLQIPHYSLTVQAADEGDPPLSSAVLITVTVTDVNDNPPVFSQVNHSLLLQVWQPEHLTWHVCAQLTLIAPHTHAHQDQMLKGGSADISEMCRLKALAYA